MKYLITERQHKLIKEDEVKIKKINFEIFNNDWDTLQQFLERRGNPPYIITGELNLTYSNIKSLGNLQSVGGDLILFGSNIKSLGNLKSVKGFLDLRNTKIESLGNLKSVGGDLGLMDTPLSKTTTREDIQSQIEVGGYIYI